MLGEGDSSSSSSMRHHHGLTGKLAPCSSGRIMWGFKGFMTKRAWQRSRGCCFADNILMSPQSRIYSSRDPYYFMGVHPLLGTHGDGVICVSSATQRTDLINTLELYLYRVVVVVWVASSSLNDGRILANKNSLGNGERFILIKK